MEAQYNRHTRRERPGKRTVEYEVETPTTRSAVNDCSAAASKEADAWREQVSVRSEAGKIIYSFERPDSGDHPTAVSHAQIAGTLRTWVKLLEDSTGLPLAQAHTRLCALRDLIKWLEDGTVPSWAPAPGFGRISIDQWSSEAAKLAGQAKSLSDDIKDKQGE